MIKNRVLDSYDQEDPESVVYNGVADFNSDEPEPQSGGMGNTSSCITKRNKFPSAQKLYTNYPKPYTKDPPNCTDKRPDGKWAYKNQCAIRMSIALSKSGVSFSTYTDPVCSHGHARGAKSLADWIAKKHLCLPKVYKGKDALDIQSKIKSKSGIIFFGDLDGVRGNDHIDLFYNDDTQAEYSNLWNALEYRFFELNEV